MSTSEDTTQTQDQFSQTQGPTDQGRSKPPLRRAYHGRMIAGVCAGLADYLGIDVTLVRVGFAVFTFLGGAGIPVYLACLLLVPEEGTDESIIGSMFGSAERSF